MLCFIYKIQFLLHWKNSLSSSMNNRLKLFREIMAVYSENHINRGLANCDGVLMIKHSLRTGDAVIKV